MFNTIPNIVAEDKKETKVHERKVKEIEALNKKEEDEQVKTGEIGVHTKGAVTGRMKYKMRKTDFQLEEELAGSLRQLKSTGKDNMLRQSWDDRFRRNLVEADGFQEGEKNSRKRSRKVQYKFKARSGGVWGTHA
jgi:hypothetical protein